MSISSITKKCMETDKPLVSIVMAVYKPNKTWLCEQLESLNRQSYPNIELLVCDDCPDFPTEEKIFSKQITEFPFKFIRNEKNIGSNKTFEKLTALASGKYISYCDQDDIWDPDKVEKMTEVLENTGSPLVCSDLRIIDGSGNKIADSITKIRKRHIFREGNGLAPKLLVSNFVTGCAMMIRSETAKSAIPFAESLVHDQWLAINAALKGKIEVIHTPLISYRQHDSNQTAALKGIIDKSSYYNERLTKYKDRLREYKNRLYFTDMKNVIDELSAFYEARIRYSQKARLKDLKIMLKYKYYARDSVLIESVMKFIPDRVFKIIISLAKKGKI